MASINVRRGVTSQKGHACHSKRSYLLFGHREWGTECLRSLEQGLPWFLKEGSRMIYKDQQSTTTTKRSRQIANVVKTLFQIEPFVAMATRFKNLEVIRNSNRPIIPCRIERGNRYRCSGTSLDRFNPRNVTTWIKQKGWCEVVFTAEGRPFPFHVVGTLPSRVGPTFNVTRCSDDGMEGSTRVIPAKSITSVETLRTVPARSKTHLVSCSCSTSLSPNWNHASRANRLESTGTEEVKDAISTFRCHSLYAGNQETRSCMA